jgi:tetratricopeptide (TPR) repeat protein
MPHKFLAGRYDILRQLGGGGFGQTYLARDQHLPGKPFCVVKKLQPKIKSPEAWDAAKRLFEAEAEVLHALGHHEQIPHLTAHFEEARQFYLVQEYIPGLVLNQSFKQSLPIVESETIELIREILTLLVFVHQNQVIHRDIKPSNLIRRESDRKIVLIDFGAVKQLTLSSIDDPSIIVGSSGYAPPEQLSGCSCFESDLYAIGMIGIQALTGYSPKHLQRDPHSHELFWRDQAEVSPEFAEVLDRLVRYDVNERYGSAQEVLDVLKHSFGQPSQPSLTPDETSNVAWVERGDYLLQRQHFREAIAAYDRALHLQPEDAALWVKQGMAYDGIQQFEAAIAAYQKATQHAPQDAKAWLKLGVLLENLHRQEEALSVYARVVELEPENVWAWHDRGKILETLKQSDAALAAYSRAVEIKPSFQLAVESRKRILLDRADAQALLQCGHYAEALVLAKRAYQKDPNNTRTLLIYGSTLAKLQRLDEAIEILNALLGSDSDHANAWLVRSEIRRQRQDWDGALQDVERALHLDLDPAKGLRVKAQIFESMAS